MECRLSHLPVKMNQAYTPNSLGQHVLQVAFVPTFLLFVLPGSDFTEVLYVPRLVVLYGYLGIWTTTQVFRCRELRLRQILQRLWRRPWFERSLIAYTLVVVGSALLSPLPGDAYFGDPISMTGAFFQVALILVYFSYRQIVIVNNITTSLYVSSLCILALLIAETLGLRLHELLLPDNYTGAYPSAGIARSSVLGGLCSLFVGLAMREVYIDPKSSLAWPWLVSALISVGITAGYAAVVSVYVCAAVLILVLLVRHRVWAAVLVGLTVVTTVNVVPTATHRLSDVLPWLEPRLSGVGYGDTTTLKTRFILWKAAVRMAVDRPIVGWGDDNFKLEVFNYLDETESETLCRLELGVPDDQSIRTFGNLCAMSDKEGRFLGIMPVTYLSPHSILFTVLVSHGLLGLGLIGLFFAGFFGSLMKVAVPLGIAATLPVTAFGIFLLGFFYIVPTAPIFWVVIGITYSWCANAVLRRDGSAFAAIIESVEVARPAQK